MHSIIEKGPYRARFANGAADILAVQRLRYAAFHDGAEGIDADEFDEICHNVMVERIEDGALLGCFRFMHLSPGASVKECYSAQFYELSHLVAFESDLLEMGRFCIDPSINDPNIVRIAWTVITRYVDAHQIGMLFGCSSFAGTDAQKYEDAFALLKERHIAPRRWLPRAKAPRVFQFAKKLRLKKPNLKLAQKRMPPLLRTYLTMGGWVSDHAVVDTHMNTLHVFTGLEIAAIPPNRKRLLRADAV